MDRRIFLRRIAAVLVPLAGANVLLADVTPGWENVNPDRREFPTTEAVWTAPSDGFAVERIGGAAGEVVIDGGLITVRKTNDVGMIVVSAPAFSVVKGRKLRFSADVQASSVCPNATKGFLFAWSGDRGQVSETDRIANQWFAGGGEYMFRLVNSAPGMTYRKFGHADPTNGVLTAALVVAGAASVSIWKNWMAEDLETAQDAWERNRQAVNARIPKDEPMPRDDFQAMIDADIDHMAEIRSEDGFSRFYVDGRPVPPIVYKSRKMSTRDDACYAGKPLQAAGVKVGLITLRLGAMPTSPDNPWSSKGFDVSAVVDSVRNAQRVGDKSVFLLAIHTSAYPAFTEVEHPDEVWIKENGKPAYGNSGSVNPDEYNDGGKLDPGDRRWPWISYASPSWRAKVKDLTAQIFAALRREGLMKRIVGVHFCGYHDGQLAMPILDYSPCAKAEYANYLRERGLREGDREATFEFFSKQLGFRALEEFSREAKRLAGKPIIAAKWCMAPFFISYDVTSFLQSDAVDVLIPQANYHKRLPSLPQGTVLPMESLHRHGKMLWMEFDLRTYAAFDFWAHSVIAAKGLNTAEDFPMWQSAVRKNAAMMTAHRMGWWFYDMADGWYRPPEIVSDIGEMFKQRLEIERTKADPWRPEAAFVIDEVAMASYNRPGYPKVAAPVTMAFLQGPRTAESGVPCDIYLAEDFYRDPDLAKRYKAIALCGFVEPDGKQRALMARIRAAGTKTMVVRSGGFTGTDFNRFARSAGAFVAVEPEVMQLDMNGDFLSAHATVAGTHVVRLPFRARSVNLKDGSECVGESLSLTMSAGETCWFRLYRCAQEK